MRLLLLLAALVAIALLLWLWLTRPPENRARPCPRCDLRDRDADARERLRRTLSHWRTPLDERGCDRGAADERCSDDLRAVNCEGCLAEARRTAEIARSWRAG